jgi:uncharacterized protein (DUF302 family)
MARTMIAVAAVLAVLAAAALPAAAELVKIESRYTVTVTLDRLEEVLTEKGIAVMARVDHAKNASTVDMPLRPTAILIFGDPRLGTRLMQDSQTIGIDLPMKVLAWEDGEGTVWIGYVDPAELAARHALSPDHEVIQNMGAALDALTQRAATQ